MGGVTGSSGVSSGVSVAPPTRGRTATGGRGTGPVRNAGAGVPDNLDVSAGSATLTNTIVAGSATNCAGTITDGGHNLEYGSGAPASRHAASP